MLFKVDPLGSGYLGQRPLQRLEVHHLRRLSFDVEMCAACFVELDVSANIGAFLAHAFINMQVHLFTLD